MRRALKTKPALLAALLVLGLAAAGCSPEYTRVRGGGPGADVGNRVLGPAMEIHGPVDPSFGEPVVGQGIQQGR